MNTEFQNGYLLGLASGGVVEVSDSAEVDALGNLIDQSGVLEDTEGTITEKVEDLIEEVDAFNYVKHSTMLRFREAQASVLKLDCADFPSLKTLENAFSKVDSLHTVYLFNTQNIESWKTCFYASSDLLHIYGDIDMSGATDVTNCFLATKFETISFVPGTIKLSIAFPSTALSAESIENIINGLATVTTAQTLTLNSAIALTDEQKATINAKGWTLAQ